MTVDHGELRSGEGFARVPMRALREYPRPAPEGHVPFPLDAVDGSVPARFEEQVRLHAGRVALRTPSRQWTYAELNAAANRAAHAILGRGAPEGTPVAVLMDQEEPAVPALLGVLKAGRPCVFLDPGDPAERWREILEATSADLLVAPAARMAQLDAVRVQGKLCWEELEADPAADDPGLPIGPDAPAVFYFTSGSTGKPKGAVRDHRQILQSTWHNTNTYFVSPSDRQSLLYFPGFAASMPNIFDTLLNGAALCALNPRRISPRNLFAWLQSEGLTHFNPPVGLWRGFLAAVPPRADVTALRLVTLSGQQVYGEDVRGFQSRFGHVAVLDYLLGMTEAGPVARAYFDETVEVVDGPVPAGYPVAGKEISILDASDRPVLPGVEGRVAITSSFMSRGYWDDDDLTAKHFLQADGDPKRMTFLTSDRGLLRPDGCLEFFGRDDTVVKIRGYRVDTAAVESVLNAHPSLLAAAVVAGTWRGTELSLAAYVVPKGEAPARSDIRAFVAGRLAAYMVPDHVLFLREMPMTDRGKIDRRALPAPVKGRPDLDTPLVPPRNDTERRLAAVWAALLEIDEVGVEDDFFELGGDSLLAMRMSLAVEEEMGRPLPADFFDAPTVARLALAMAGEARSVASSTSLGAAGRAGTDRAQEGEATIAGRLRRALAKGPVWRGRCLPYGPGLILQKALIAQPWVRRHFADNLSLVRQWARELAVGSDPGELAAVSLMANVWPVWRAQALNDPRAIGRWLVVDDPGLYLQDATASPAGMVLAVPHAGRLGNIALAMCGRRGRETAAVVNDPALGKMEPTEEWRRRQSRARTEMVLAARRVLERGGVVLVAADGYHGEQAVEVPFFGRRRPFQIGAAELAVTTGAAFVPVYARIDIDGRVRIDVCRALTAEGDTPQSRVVGLTLRYARDYVARWPEMFASMNWNHLERNLQFPGISETGVGVRGARP
jgi:amino acid adenylation domain-containing protein